MIKGSCHCGAVTFEIADTPSQLVSYTCSICRRLATLWAYSPPLKINLNAPEGATLTYVYGDKELRFHTCNTCGCTTHWSAIGSERFSVNMRLVDPADIEKIPIRHFDGADSWEFLD